MPALRIVFAGTPEFARPSFLRLITEGHDVIAAFTQPDRPAGRGRRLAPSAIKQAAQQAGVPVRTPSTGGEMLAQLEAFAPVDVMVVAAYGLILPRAVLDLPRLGCLNVHASLLPRWRGAAPVARAIEAGDTTTGVTIMQMDEGLDTGPMLESAHVPIESSDTTEGLTARLSVVGADLMAATVGRLARDLSVSAMPQPASGATYARKLSKTEAPLDWARPAIELERKVRALAPWPGTTIAIGDQILKVGAARPTGGTGEPGEILAIADGQVVVTAGSGALALDTLQEAGKRYQPAAIVAARLGWKKGDRFSWMPCAMP